MHILLRISEENVNISVFLLDCLFCDGSEFLVLWFVNHFCP